MRIWVYGQGNTVHVQANGATSSTPVTTTTPTTTLTVPISASAIPALPSIP